MNKYLRLVSVLFLMVSCEKPAVQTDNGNDGSGTHYEINVSAETLNAPGEGGVLQFRVTCEDAWQITVDQTWVLVSPESGTTASGRKIDVVVYANTTSQQRTASLTVASGGASKVVTIVQEPFVQLTELLVNVSELSLSASGQQSGAVRVSSPVSFSVSCDAGWVALTDKAGSALSASVGAGKDIEIKVVPQANFDGVPRAATVTVSASGYPTRTVAVSQTAESFVTGTAELPAVWLFNDENITSLRQTFIGPGYVQASRGSSATISIHREAVNQQKETLDYNVASDGGLEMRMLGEGDYFLYNVPVNNLPAGSNVHITASYHSDNSANKYFVFEYLDAGEWKMTKGLKTSPEGVKYHYQSNGLGLSQAYTPNIDETVTLSQGITSGALKMRLRCVGNRKYDGSALSFTSNALTRMAAAKTHGTSPIVRLLDGPRPTRKIKVLFVGNSYTYYNWSSYMLKEIAWKEGLEIEVGLSAHSGFTIEKHNSHSVTKSFVEAGGYDYAIVQEYNDRTAVVGADLSKGSLGTDAAKYVADMKTMISEIRKSSPSVTALLEMSWGTKTGTGSLIKTDWTDYVTMQGYVTEGTRHVASETGVGYTLLGEAWKKVRTERPDIEMYHTDQHHPSYAGSYLKACVNYLTLSGKEFGDNPCDCLLDPQTASYLRSVAESIVLD